MKDGKFRTDGDKEAAAIEQYQSVKEGDCWKKPSFPIIESVGDDGETLEFSIAQIEYFLRSVLEGQRRWVATLSAREKSAMDELDEISNSVISFGSPFEKPRNCSFEDEMNPPFRRGRRIRRDFSELFPLGLLITPELLPESGAQ